MQKKDELTDTEARLLDDNKLCADTEKDCVSKAGEWASIVKIIQLMNDGYALEMFKRRCQEQVQVLFKSGSSREAFAHIRWWRS